MHQLKTNQTLCKFNAYLALCIDLKARQSEPGKKGLEPHTLSTGAKKCECRHHYLVHIAKFQILLAPQEAGAEPVRLNVYQTAPGPSSHCVAEKQLLLNGHIHAIAFSSTAEVSALCHAICFASFICDPGCEHLQTCFTASCHKGALLVQLN